MFSYVYELPLGRNKQWLNGGSAWTNALAGGWALTGITSFRSGAPLLVSASSSDLLPQILPQAKAFTGEIPSISAGRDAAFATVKLMSEAAEILPPSTPIDKYIKLGGGS